MHSAGVYLVRTLELLLVKIKVSTESPNSEQGAQECRFVSCQRGAVGVLLVLSLQLSKSSFNMDVIYELKCNLLI